jgi:gliding motility-associated-like protein
MYNAFKCITNYLPIAVAMLLCFFFIPHVATAQVDQVVQDGAPVAPSNFPNTGCVYKWVNDNPSIGLAAKGTGDIASFTAINKGYAPVTATITGRVITYGYQSVGNTTYAIDLIDYSQAGIVPVPSAILQGTSPDGSVSYFQSGTDNHTLYKVDGRNNNLLATILVPAGFYTLPAPNSNVLGLFFSPDGKKIFTYSAQTKAILIINTITNAVENTISLNPGLTYNPIIQMSPDGTRIYLISGGTSSQSVLTIVNTVTNSVASTVNLAVKAGRLFLTANGTQLYITSNDTGTFIGLVLYNTTTGDVSTIPTPAGMAFSTISLDGKKAYFTQSTLVDYGYPYHIMDIKTGNMVPANLGFTYTSTIIHNPNGEYIYFKERATGTIKVVSTKTDEVVGTIKQSSVIGINVISQADQLSYDGSKLYQTMLVSVNNVEERGYIQMIDTKTNKIIDSISLKPARSNPLFLSRGADPCTGAPVTFTITVNPPQPVINVTGTLTNVDALYGTAGASTSFIVSGINLPTGIMVTPPVGFEVSTDGITYIGTLTIGLPGTVAPTKVYLRLKLTSRVRSYSGDVLLSSGTASTTVPTVLSTVTPAPLVITAAITKKYGDILNDAARSTVFTAIGLKNSETIGGITIHYGAGAVATDAVGTYTGAVTASAAASGTFSPSNYAITYPQSDVIVEAAPLTITADDKERNYGETNPVLTFKYSGFVNNEGIEQLTTLPITSTVAFAASPIGRYPITISGAVAANYNLNYVPGTLTVKSTVVTINTAFTPNDDGINDTWEINKIGQYNNCTVEVLNRYGEKVFYSIGYPTAWNGKRGGANLPIGTYYYIIRLTSSIKPLTGSLTIIR